MILKSILGISKFKSVFKLNERKIDITEIKIDMT